MIAQSLINEGIYNVLYVCATIDLVIQTEREALERLGLELTTRIRSKFSNKLYESGKGICVTTYQSVFNSKSVFVGDKHPQAIIFDDAHVAEKLIRDCYTLRISNSSFPECYAAVLELLRLPFEQLGYGGGLRNVLAGDSQHDVVLVPPSASAALGDEIGAVLHSQKLQDSPETLFSLGHVYGNINKCAITISADAIEIAPPFLPVRALRIFAAKGVRRIYLSATLEDKSDFCRAFGRLPEHIIKPDSDAGNGERLIVSIVGEKPKIERDAFIGTLAKRRKVLVAAPSYAAAKKYKDLSVPPRPEHFTDALNTFRDDKRGVFILVSRVDGIDLPDDTCRIMALDGTPTGFTQIERFQHDWLELRNFMASKIANRITQLFGRINRGRKDYGAYLVVDQRLDVWLSTDRFAALLPELLRKQVKLGESIRANLADHTEAAITALIDQVLSREGVWLRYYGDYIEGMDVSEEIKTQAIDLARVYEEAALSESRFMSLLWDGAVQDARQQFKDALDQVAVADGKLAAWYHIWIGLTYELEKDSEAAAKQYNAARSRLTANLVLPRPTYKDSQSSREAARNPFHEKLLSIFQNDVKLQNDEIHKLAGAFGKFEEASTSNLQEEAVRRLGEFMGFKSTRPDHDDHIGPDVLWRDETNRTCLGFEVKMNKKVDWPLNKDEIGQGHDHLEWMRQNSDGADVLGLVYVGSMEACTGSATPSDLMWIASPEAIRGMYRRLIALLSALQRLTPIERYPELEATSERAEWALQAVFDRLQKLPVKP